MENKNAQNIEKFLLDNDLCKMVNIDMAKDESKKTGEDIIRILIRRKFLNEIKYMQKFAESLGFSFKRLDPLELNPEVVTVLPERLCRQHEIVTIEKSGNILYVAISKKADMVLIDDLRRITDFQIKWVVALQSEIMKVINEFYGFEKSLDKALKDYQGSDISVDITDVSRIKQSLVTDKGLINLVDLLIHKAIEQRASDIHIEPKKEFTHIRLRIDGLLHTIRKLPRQLHLGIISRIKIMSGLDLAEKRRPQDGRIRIEHADRNVELRISLIPTVFGEKAVLRLLDPDILMKNLDQVGFNDQEREKFIKLLQHTHGIVLLTGPTGSGKTTTLYSAMNYIKCPDKNITTIEEPVELICEDFNQVSINDDIGMGFANALRTLLRQDPDIIMVGEIRDLDTAENAIRAALTGHLVLSTLHTNDSVSAITRLEDIGVEPYLISSTLLGVVAQRLIRTVCPYCKEYFNPTTAELKILNINESSAKNLIFSRGKGCRECNDTGYLGRTAIFEILPITHKMIDFINMEVTLEKMRELSLKEGLISLRESAIRKLVRGLTTIEEVIRVTPSA
ncbi:MAG: GspE/PulE family protein [bacterium]|nr:GspE/PulE family protein [bacterium]